MAIPAKSFLPLSDRGSRFSRGRRTGEIVDDRIPE